MKPDRVGCPSKVTRCALTGLLVLLSLVESANAQRAIRPWRLTGAQLVQRLGNVDPSTVPWSAQSSLPSRALAAQWIDANNGHFVLGYFQAVRDLTEGKSWCWSPVETKPDEMWDAVRIRLQRMTDAQLKRDGADLIVEVLQERWPCASRRKP
ncbi:Rap1a/Tai family immunity protein [[Empedobacter] haloabium]|uniref:Rap1a/Tai family immunity protein n=1 Tax=[Empedobacter] haloabium TaxID=592317 RepID=A0ABZ1UST4_9BURK